MTENKCAVAISKLMIVEREGNSIVWVNQEMLEFGDEFKYVPRVCKN